MILARAAIWRRVFLIGLFSFFVVALGNLLSVVAFSAGASDSVVSEGSSISKSVRVSGFFVYLIAGFILLIPCVAHLFELGEQVGRGFRMTWAIVLLLFPFFTPYLYFGLFLRSKP